MRSFERLSDLLDVAELDDALNLLPRHQADLHGRDDAEQPVPADDVSKQIGIHLPITLHDRAVGEDHFERFDVRDERRVSQPATVNVRADRTADREAVSAGLLLPDAPRVAAVALRDDVVANEIRPRDAGLRMDHAALPIEVDDAVHAAHVEQPAVCGELLPAHRMTRAAHAHELAARAHLPNEARRFFQSRGRETSTHRGGIELRVDVVANRRRQSSHEQSLRGSPVIRNGTRWSLGMRYREAASAATFVEALLERRTR